MPRGRPAAVANGARTRTKPPRYTDDETAEVPPEEYEPVQLSAQRKRKEPDRIPLFYLDDREYTAPAKVPVKVALNAIRLARRMGWADAMWFVLEQSVGEDTINLLAEHAEQDEMDAIFTRLRQLYLGQVEAMAGNS